MNVREYFSNLYWHKLIHLAKQVYLDGYMTTRLLGFGATNLHNCKGLSRFLLPDLVCLVA